MKTIMIIGAGQLGSRHLQGAIQSELSLHVIVVDPFQDSLNVAKQRANEIQFGNSETRISYTTKIESSVSIDICIIATTANIRFSVFEELILRCPVKNIIFEKVLFQKENEYLHVENLLSSNDIQAWVNCPRRMNLSYTKIKELLTHETELSMVVTGSNWGLACNAIHFIDLFSFITRNSDIVIDGSLLNDKVMPSKRNGFYEVLGTLVGRDSKGNTFQLYCSERDQVSIEVKISTPNYQIIVKESTGELVIINSSSKVEEYYKSFYQSQLTHLNIQEILEQGDSSLTTFSESKNIHIPFIRSMKKHIEKSLDEQLDSCPIT